MRRGSFVRLGLSVAVVLGVVSSTSPTLPPGFLSAYKWHGAAPLFGGFSAIDITPDGSRFLTINDKSGFVFADVKRDDQDRIILVTAEIPDRFRDKNGKHYVPYRGDTEGLAIAEDGTVFVSFEQYARVTKFTSPTALGQLLPRPEAFLTMHQNAALEALAIAKDGTLFTLPERPPANTTTFQVYRFQNGIWDQPFALPRRGFYLAVGADIGPDGRFYLLERRFHGLSGFSSRVRRFSIGLNQMDHEETLLETKPGQHDNLEGMSVWRDKAGFLRLTMISDNNFLFVQRTEIVEYRVPD